MTSEVKPAWSRRKRIVLTILGLLLLGYLSSYYVISRRGYAFSKDYNIEGFFYLEPEDTDSWRMWNYGLAIFYLPVNLLDQALGTGLPPTREPTWRMGKY